MTLDVLEMLIKVILALLVVGFVGYPLVRGVWAEEEAPEFSAELEELHRRKESTYSALKELEFDFKTGKLSEGDFNELDARYRGDALDILEAIDSAERGTQPAATRRRAAGPRPQPQAAAAVLEAGECGECGRLNAEGSRFCAGCGTTLDDDGPAPAADVGHDEDEQVCSGCGLEYQPGHRFCAGCGTEVGS
ncbi:MAG: double zinc ribbon domain-containing protein [Thermoleophilia bacterium]